MFCVIQFSNLASILFHPMLFSKDTLKSFASSKGISEIDDTVFQLLSQDLEYRIKELAQEATKFMYSSHRTKLSIDDINYALISRNIDPLFGYDPTEQLSFKQVNNIFYVPDEEIDLEVFLNKPLPKIPQRPVIQSHWLAIEGVQPQIPQNIIKDSKKETTSTLQHFIEDVEIKVTTKHVLPKELQMYFDKINTFIRGTEEERVLALECLENDSGIQQLIPYFIHAFYEFIITNKEEDTKATETIVTMLYGILKNSYIFIDPYLHQIVPAIMTGLIGNDFNRQTRSLSMEAIIYLYERFSTVYASLGPRIINLLKKNFIDITKSEDIRYYALLTISKLKNDILSKFYQEHKDDFNIEDQSKEIKELLAFL